MGYRDEIPNGLEEVIRHATKLLDSNAVRRLRYGLDDLLNEIEQQTRDFERWGNQSQG